MCEMVTIMEREAQNTGLVYIYREEGNWYAYEQSAFFLCQMMDNLATFGKLINNVVWLTCAEVKIESIPLEHLVSYCDDEYVLYYVPRTKNTKLDKQKYIS